MLLLAMHFFLYKHFNEFPVDVKVALGLLVLAYLPEDEEGGEVHGDYVVAVALALFIQSTSS